MTERETRYKDALEQIITLASLGGDVVKIVYELKGIADAALVEPPAPVCACGRTVCAVCNFPLRVENLPASGPAGSPGVHRNGQFYDAAIADPRN